MPRSLEAVSPSSHLSQGRTKRRGGGVKGVVVPLPQRSAWPPFLLAGGPLLDADDDVEAVGVEDLAPGDLHVLAAVLDVLLEPLSAREKRN